MNLSYVRFCIRNQSGRGLRKGKEEKKGFCKVERVIRNKKSSFDYISTRDHRNNKQPKMMVTNSEKRKVNENILQDKLLKLARKDLDMQLNRKQAQLKRERVILMDQYLDYKANNYKTLYKKKEFDSFTQSLPNSLVLPSLNNSRSVNSTSDLKLNVNQEIHYNIYEKFVEQKRKYFPSYLKNTNRLQTSVPVYENVLGKSDFYFCV